MIAWPSPEAQPAYVVGSAWTTSSMAWSSPLTALRLIPRAGNRLLQKKIIHLNDAFSFEQHFMHQECQFMRDVAMSDQQVQATQLAMNIR